MPSKITKIDTAIQRGRGAAAKVLGQSYVQYRLTGATNTGVVSGTPITSDFLARLSKTTKKAAIENEVFGLQVFEAMCDNRTLQIGDVLVETGYESLANNVFTVAQIRPTRETLWVRTEFNCALTRPRPRAGQSSQQPASGFQSMPQYGGTDDKGEWILELVDGLYGFTSSPGVTPASVQCGLVPLNRERDGSSLGTPTDLPRAHFIVYVPNLPGQPLDVYDRIKFPNADKYEILSFGNSEEAGFEGYICICEKV